MNLNHILTNQSPKFFYKNPTNPNQQKPQKSKTYKGQIRKEAHEKSSSQSWGSLDVTTEAA